MAASRGLDLSLDDIGELLDLRDRREAPCRVVPDLLIQIADAISWRIIELRRLEADLRELHKLRQTFPMDGVDEKNCVCHLVSERAASER